MNANLDFREGEAVLAMSGALTVEKGGEIKRAISEALGAGGDVYLRVEGVAAMDFSFVQMVYAARNKALSENRKLRVSGPEAFMKAVRDAGFLHALDIVQEGGD